MKTDFNEVVQYYKKTLQSKTDKSDWIEGFQSKVDLAAQVHGKLEDRLTVFFEIVFGYRKEEFPQMSSMFFSQRFLKDKNTLNSNEVKKIMRDFFYLGYFYHMVFTESDTRQNIKNIDMDKVFEKWLPDTVKAAVIMRDHIKEENKMPEMQFKAFYNDNQYESFFEKKAISFHKIAKIYTYLKNIYYSGVMLGLYCDMEASE